MHRGSHPFRDPAPSPPAPEEPEDPAKGERRRRRIATYVLLAISPFLLVLAFAGVQRKSIFDLMHPARPLTEAQRMEVRAALDAAKEKSNREQSAYAAGMAQAIHARLEGRPELGRCPYTFPQMEHDAFDHGETVRTELSGVPSGKRDPLKSSSALIVNARIMQLLPEIDEPEVAAPSGDGLMGQARRLSSAEKWTTDLAFVLDEIRKPVLDVVKQGGFTAGWVRGRAYLWDYKEQRVVCAAAVEATSSKAVEFSYRASNFGTEDDRAASGHSALMRDLDDQTYRAIVTAMKWRSAPAIP